MFAHVVELNVVALFWFRVLFIMIYQRYGWESADEAKLLAEYKNVKDMFKNKESYDVLMGRLMDVLPLDENKFKVEWLVESKESFKAVLNTQLESAADINSFTQNWRLRNHETLRGKTPSTSKTYEFIR